MEEEILCSQTSPVILLWENAPYNSLWGHELARLFSSYHGERQQIKSISFTPHLLILTCALIISTVKQQLIETGTLSLVYS